jgi:putative ABC transport system permease protein
MKIIIALQLAWRSLRLNILRTSLTVLGVIIGVAAIIVVFAAGESLERLILNEVDSYGTDIIQTEIRVPTAKNEFAIGEVTTLKLSDMEAIDRLPNIKRSYAAVIGQQRVGYQNQGKNVLLMGVSANYPLIDQKSQLIEGRFFSEEEDRSQARVAVLGYSLRQELFGDQEVLGQMINLGNSKYRVLGVLEERGGLTAGFLNFDDAIYLPVQTLQKRILGIDHVIYFIHQLEDISIAEQTAEEIRFLMRDRHEIIDPSRDDFRISTMDEALEMINMITGAITFLLLVIVLISLLVGGVGIMNIMYVTVTERTPEIGLRKSLGANSKDIIYQFLIEALLITFWGWLLGVIFGLIVSWFLIYLANDFGINLIFIFPWQGVIVAVIFSIFCGFLFGIRPAKSASKLDPVEAIRTE